MDRIAGRWIQFLPLKKKFRHWCPWVCDCLERPCVWKTYGLNVSRCTQSSPLKENCMGQRRNQMGHEKFLICGFLCDKFPTCHEIGQTDSEISATNHVFILRLDIVNRKLVLLRHCLYDRRNNCQWFLKSKWVCSQKWQMYSICHVKCIVFVLSDMTFSHVRIVFGVTLRKRASRNSETLACQPMLDGAYRTWHCDSLPPACINSRRQVIRMRYSTSSARMSRRPYSRLAVAADAVKRLLASCFLLRKKNDFLPTDYSLQLNVVLPVGPSAQFCANCSKTREETCRRLNCQHYYGSVSLLSDVKFLPGKTGL